MAKIKHDEDAKDAKNIKAVEANLLTGELKQHPIPKEIPKDWAKVLIGNDIHKMVIKTKNYAIEMGRLDAIGEWSG